MSPHFKMPVTEQDTLKLQFTLKILGVLSVRLLVTMRHLAKVIKKQLKITYAEKALGSWQNDML